MNRKHFLALVISLTLGLLITANKAIAQFCTGQTTLTTATGTFSDGSGTANYANNSNCSWLIQPTGNPASITLTMDSITMSGFTDAVRVYDGTSAAGTLVAIYNGTNTGSVAIANSGSMFVQFTSNFFGNAAGWRASYTSASSNCQANVIFSANNSDFTDGTRNGSNYDNNTDCEWLIQPTNPNVFVEVNFSRYDIANGDSLILYDGATTNSPVLATLLGSTTVGTYQSSGGSLLVKFKTNATTTSNGWRIVYNSQPIPACNGLTTLTSVSGLFTDGSLPFNNYIENSNCQWLISPLGAVTIDLNFNYFITEANSDFVTVYDGSNNTGTLLGSFSGNTIPPTLTSTTGSMFIEFTTDNQVNAIGWEGSFISSNTSTVDVSVDTVYLNAGAGSTTSFQVSANAGWATSDNANWLISTPINSSGNQTVNLIAAQGNIGPERTAQVFINSANGNSADTVVVIQSTSGRFLDIIEDTLFVTSTNAPNQNITVQANVNWNLTPSANWINVFPANGNNNGTPLISVLDNTTIQTRKGYVVISGTLGASNDTLFVVQDPVKGTFSVSPKSIILDPAAGSNDSILVQANLSWTLSNPSNNWISVNSNIPSDTFYLKISALSSNPSTSNRSDYLYFTAGNGLFSDSVLVTQLGIPPFLSTTPDSISLGMLAGTSGTLNISSSGTWNVMSSDPWFSANINSGTGDTTISISSNSMNNTNSSRIGTLLITDVISNLIDTTIIIQEGVTGIINASPSNLSLASNSGSTASFNISSDVNWTISPPPGWLTISPQSGSNNLSIDVTSNSSNQTGADRVATLTITGIGALNKTVTITQLDANSNSFLLSSDTIFLDSPQASTTDFTVISSATWTLSETSSWLALNKTGGTNTEVVTARASSANIIGSPRFATVTASSSGLPDRILVVAQLGAPLIFNFSPDPLIIGADSSSFGKVDITSNLVSWAVTNSSNWLSVTPTSGSFSSEITVTATEVNTSGLPRSGSVTISSAPFTPLSVNVIQDTSRSIGINKNNLSNQISIYPNPSNGQVYIKFNADVDINTVAIEAFDITGKAIDFNFSVLKREHLLFDFSEVTNGFYFLRIRAEGEVLTTKILLLK